MIPTSTKDAAGESRRNSRIRSGREVVEAFTDASGEDARRRRPGYRNVAGALTPSAVSGSISPLGIRLLVSSRPKPLHASRARNGTSSGVSTRHR